MEDPLQVPYDEARQQSGQPGIFTPDDLFDINLYGFVFFLGVQFLDFEKAQIYRFLRISRPFPLLIFLKPGVFQII